jgi:hypothetical protein
MPEVWVGVARDVGLAESAPARQVAALHGMVLVPGATNDVRVRGRVLCYPRDAEEADLRAAVIRWVTGDDVRDPARSYVDLVAVGE